MPEEKKEEKAEESKKDQDAEKEVSEETEAEKKKEAEEPQVEQEPEEVLTQEDLEEEIKEDTSEDVKEDKKTKIPEFRPGDTIRLHYKIIEGDKTRIQPFEGIVISKKGKGVSKTFTVRRIAADGVGVERIFPLHSPNISKIEIKRRGKVRRSKLYYLRKKKGRAAVRVKDKKETKKTKAAASQK